MNDEADKKNGLDTETPDTDAPEADVADDAGVDGDETNTFEQLTAELDSVRDQMLRAVAEAENTRKISEREVKDARAYAVTAFARDLLSVADNFSRALASLTPDMREGMGEAGKTLLEGVEMTEKELHSVLSRHGVTQIPSDPGVKVDANLHEAVTQMPADQDAGCIAQTVQAGWKIGDRTLRAAMVVVSSGPPAPAEAVSDEDVPEAPSSDAEPGGVVNTKV